MTTFTAGAIARKNAHPRSDGDQFTGIERNQWQKGWDWEHFNPSGTRLAGHGDSCGGIRESEKPRKDFTNYLHQ